MKNLLRSFAILGSVGMLSSIAQATPVCGTSGNPCENPAAVSQSITINAASLLGIDSLNSVGPNGNATSSNYFFAVSNTDLGNTVGTINNSGTGLTVVGVTPTHPASSTPGTTVTAGQVQGTKGGTTYWVYAQACPSATSANGANCSQWVKVDASQVTTTAYPGSVFSAPSAGADATLNSISVRTNVPGGDVANVSAIDLTVNDLINGANDETLNPISYSGNGSPYVINNTAFTNGFKPNNKYQYTGQVQYPWDLVPTGGPQSVGPLWTTPENPGPVSVLFITHCEAGIQTHNSNISTPNPTYTEYSLCATGTSGSCATSARIGGTPSQSDSVAAAVTGLAPGTTYTPTATALVGNQDGSSSGWNNSGTTSGSNFTTLAWGGIPGIANITTTSADYTFSVLDTSGVVNYQIILNGVSQGVVPGAPTSPIHLTGLTPDTQYTVAMQLSESACTSPTILSQPFTTTAATPVTFGLTDVDATDISASWANGGNPGGITYSLQYCTDPGFTLNCNIVTTTSLSTTLSGLTPNTQYFAHVKALTVGGGGLDSAYSNSASATTSNFILNPSSATVVTGNSQLFTGNESVTWSVNGGGSLSTAGPSTSTTFTAVSTGTWTLTAKVGAQTVGTGTITVTAAGPVVDSFNFSMSAGNKGGTLTIVGHDNVVHAVSSSFSSDPSVTFNPTTLSNVARWSARNDGRHFLKGWNLYALGLSRLWCEYVYRRDSPSDFDQYQGLRGRR